MPRRKYRKKKFRGTGSAYVGRAIRSVVPNLSQSQKVASTAYTAFKTAKIAMSLLNVELKHFDTAHTLYPYTSNFNSVALFNIPQGDADNQRNGEKLRIKSLNISAVAYKNNGVDNTLVKFVLVKCPTVHSDTSPQTQVYVDPLMCTFRNMDYTKKYSVIWTKTISLSTITNKKLIDKYIKLNIPVSYTSSAGDSVEANQYYLLVTSDQENTNSTLPTITLKTRVRYIDN